MARRSSSSSSSSWLAPISSVVFPRGSDSVIYLFAILSILSLFLNHLVVLASADSHFEGFDDEPVVDEDAELDSRLDDLKHNLRSTPLSSSPDPPPNLEIHSGPSDDFNQDAQAQPSDKKPTSLSGNSGSGFEYWDEDEFEGLPVFAPEEKQVPAEDIKASENATEVNNLEVSTKRRPQNYTVEVICLSFLIMFLINYFTGKKENEKLALAWAGKFATKDSIFDKNFSLLGVGEGDDSPLLLKEGNTVFKFYASGRRYCQGLLATLDLKSRHDLISRIYNFIVPCKDEITFEVYMNDDAMDQVLFAVARKKLAKVMSKELRDLAKFAGVVGAPSGRKWIADELSVVSESKEVAGDLITELVLDQVFGEKAFEKFGKGFISMHFSDQNVGMHKKVLLFKFALPDEKNMADMTRLVALVPYYIDLIGRYKLSPQAKSKTDGARVKAAQEAFKELQNARQDAIQKKRLEKKKMLEEAEAKLSAEALRKREAKERARQLKKSMPKVKMTRGH